MNVLMVYPEFPDTFWSFKHALKFVRKRASLPPLGLLTVAAMLPTEWGKRLIDVNVRALKDRDLAWADAVMISAMVVQKPSARAILARCQAAGKPVIAGGPLFTSEYADFPEVDHFVLDEAEVTLPRFLADWAAGTAQRLYRAEAYPGLEQTPVPLWHLADLQRYASMAIQFSRGCPFDCDFCNVTALFGHRPRCKTAAQIIAELDALYAAGWRAGVFFVDDNLIGNKRYLRDDLLPALIQWRRTRPEVTFCTEVSINIADDDALMQRMVEAGFDTVFIGIETPDEASLAECSKTQNTRRDLVANIQHIQRQGLQVQGGFIVGFDSDTDSIFERQIDFIQRSGIATAMVGLLQAIPGTRLHERMRQEGRLVGQTTGDNVDGTTNIVPKMNADRLQAGYRQILEHIYAPKAYYSRVKTLLREYRAPAIRTPITWGHLLAFWRSVVRLGILGRERCHYWKLMLWTQFRRPELLHLAVVLAIYGHHFRKVCERHVSKHTPAPKH
jgi:radical SAM superfamily enzyme YgiQ (UPF0313 family)